MAVRKWHVQQALGSFTQLAAVLSSLTAAEIVAALELESATSRRTSTIDRLIARAVRLNELAYAARLTDKYRRPAAPPPS